MAEASDTVLATGFLGETFFTAAFTDAAAFFAEAAEADALAMAFLGAFLFTAAFLGGGVGVAEGAGDGFRYCTRFRR